MVAANDNSSLRLVLCSPHHAQVHGFVAGRSSPGIDGHFIVEYTFRPDELSQGRCIQMTPGAALLGQAQRANPHARLRHYVHVALSGRIRGPQLARVVRLEGGEDVAVIKTCWLRILQRRCRKKLADRNP